MWHKNSDFRDRVMILYQVVSVYELVKLHVLTRLLFVQRVFGSESFFFFICACQRGAELDSSHVFIFSAPVDSASAYSFFFLFLKLTC